MNKRKKSISILSRTAPVVAVFEEKNDHEEKEEATLSSRKRRRGSLVVVASPSPASSLIKIKQVGEDQEHQAKINIVDRCGAAALNLTGRGKNKQLSLQFRYWNIFISTLKENPTLLKCDRLEVQEAVVSKNLPWRIGLNKDAKQNFRRKIGYFWDISLNPTLPFEITTWEKYPNQLQVVCKTSNFDDLRRELIGFYEFFDETLANRWKREGNYDCFMDLSTNCQGAVYGPLQLVNHSCGSGLAFNCGKFSRYHIKDPTSYCLIRMKEVVHPNGRKSIKKGKELLIKYSDTALTMFDCSCELCTNH